MARRIGCPGFSKKFRYRNHVLARFVRFSGDNRARRNHFDNEETEILVIPDLDDEGEEDIVTKGGYVSKETRCTLVYKLFHGGIEAAVGLRMAGQSQTHVTNVYLVVRPLYSVPQKGVYTSNGGLSES